jgi:hypothetical protein
MTNRYVVALCVLGLALAACSKGASQTAGGTATASQAPAGNACDRKLLTAADVTDLLGAPVTETKTIPGDAQTCVFNTGGFNSVSVTLRPGLGDVTVKTWLDGKMPVSAVAQPGVGDRAAWVSDLSEVVATKGNVLCDIQFRGGGTKTAAQQTAIGGLCNKIFAAS